MFRWDQSDFDGSFTLPGVIPGTYTVIAIADGWNVDFSAPNALARYLSRGQRVTVTREEQGAIRLPAPVEAHPR